MMLQIFMLLFCKRLRLDRGVSVTRGPSHVENRCFISIAGHRCAREPVK